MKYIVRVIILEGKNKNTVEEMYEADHYRRDEHNNLILEEADGTLVIEFHSFNNISIKPVSTENLNENGY